MDRTRGIGKFLQKRVNQERNVGFSLPQRRELHLHNVEAEIQVLAESPGSNARFQIPVCRGDHARADADPLVGPDRLDFTFLQGPQNLGLQVDGQVADFIEKKRAFPRGFE